MFQVLVYRSAGLDQTPPPRALVSVILPLRNVVSPLVILGFGFEEGPRWSRGLDESKVFWKLSQAEGWRHFATIRRNDTSMRAVRSTHVSLYTSCIGNHGANAHDAYTSRQGWCVPFAFLTFRRFAILLCWRCFRCRLHRDWCFLSQA